MSRSKGYGFQTKFSSEAHTTNSAAWPVHYACAVVFSFFFFFFQIQHWSTHYQLRSMASTLRMRRGFQLEVHLKAPAKHLSPSFPWWPLPSPPPPPLRPRYVVQFITGGGGGGGGWLLGGSLCDPSPALPVFSSLCVFRPLSTPFVWHTSYRAGKYVPYSVLSASLENITTRLHMKGCKGVHNLCVGVGLFYQTSSSPQLQLR